MPVAAAVIDTDPIQRIVAAQLITHCGCVVSGIFLTGISPFTGCCNGISARSRDFFVFLFFFPEQIRQSHPRLSLPLLKYHTLQLSEHRVPGDVKEAQQRIGKSC